MKNALKKMYQRIPFKRQAFELIRSVGTPPHWLYKHLHFRGGFTLRPDARHRFLINHYGNHFENELFWKGLSKGWEKESMKLWLKLAKTAAVVFDVGANVGLYSLVTKAVNPAARVVAFEPVERIYDRLVANVKLNNFDVMCEKLALSDHDGTGQLYEDEEMDFSLSFSLNPASNAQLLSTSEVKTVRLDTYLTQHHITALDLIKIDVEMHEPAVMRGFANQVAAFKPAILIEILTDDIGRQVEAVVGELGYLYFNIDEDGGITREPRLKASKYYNYLLCNEATARNLALI